LSSAHGSDEFIVREYLAEEAPRVIVLSDRRPAMSLFPRPLPWLDKPEAMRQAAGLVVDATLAARGFFGYLDLGGGEERGVWPRTTSCRRRRSPVRSVRPRTTSPWRSSSSPRHSRCCQPGRSCS